MSLLKVPFLVAIHHVTFTHPGTHPTSEERVQPTGVERLMSPVAAEIPSFGRTVLWTLMINLREVSVILAARFPNSVIARSVLGALTGSSSPSNAIGSLRVDAMYLVLWALTVAGGLLRLAFRALGRQFTYRIALRKSHMLVPAGPYAVVRHPSYSGAALLALGTTPHLFRRGSWLAECVLPRMPAVMWAARASAMVYWLMILGTVARVPKEDRLLREAFRSEWVEWAQRTPYKMVPYAW